MDTSHEDMIVSVRGAAAARPRKTRLGAVRLLCRPVPRLLRYCGVRGHGVSLPKGLWDVKYQIPATILIALFRNGEQENGKEKLNAHGFHAEGCFNGTKYTRVLNGMAAGWTALVSLMWVFVGAAVQACIGGRIIKQLMRARSAVKC